MRPPWFVTIAAAETALVLFVLLVTAWQFGEWASNAGQPGVGDTMAARMPTFDSSYLVVAILVAAGIYGLIQLFGKSSLALWIVVVLTIVPQIPGIWSHNKLGWERFMGVETTMGEGHSLLLAGALFVASLLGLIVLHRLIALRKLGRLLTSRRVDAAERDSTLVSEGMSLTVIVGLALLLSLLLVGAGTGLAESAWFVDKLPWAVVTIGGGASVLLIGFIALFLRGLSEEARASGPGSGD